MSVCLCCVHGSSGPSSSSSSASSSAYESSSSSSSSLYGVLGVSSSSSGSEIKAAYRSLARTLHPDKLVGASVAKRHEASQKFILVASSYEILAEENSRQQYNNNVNAAATQYKAMVDMWERAQASGSVQITQDEFFSRMAQQSQGSVVIGGDGNAWFKFEHQAAAAGNSDAERQAATTTVYYINPQTGKTIFHNPSFEAVSWTVKAMRVVRSLGIDVMPPDVALPDDPKVTTAWAVLISSVALWLWRGGVAYENRIRASEREAHEHAESAKELRQKRLEIDRAYRLKQEEAKEAQRAARDAERRERAAREATKEDAAKAAAKAAERREATAAAAATANAAATVVQSEATRLRLEQDDAYEESLREDRAREEERRKRQEKEEAEKRAAQLEKERKAAERAESDNEAAPEPSTGPRVALRLPNGSRIMRRFSADDPLLEIRRWARRALRDTKCMPDGAWSVKGEGDVFPTSRDELKASTVAQHGVGGSVLNIVRL